MEIGGYDTFYHTEDAAALMRTMLEVVGWAEPVTEKLEPTELMREIPADLLDEVEFCVYPDQAAKDAWDKDLGPDGTMIYFIVSPDSLTVVTDEGLTQKIRLAFPPQP
jgi:hypothetical protein